MGCLEVLYSIGDSLLRTNYPLVHLGTQVATHRLHHQQQATSLFKKYL